MAFGPSYSYSLIRLLYGEKWSDGEASTALRCYCFYVIVLAMNGNLPCLILLFIFILSTLIVCRLQHISCLLVFIQSKFFAYIF